MGNTTVRAKGFASAICSAICYGLMPLLAKAAYAEGANSVSVAFYRFCLSLFPLFIYFVCKKVSLKITLAQFMDILIGTVVGYGSTALLLYLSYNYIPSGMATTIHFGYPAMVVAGSALFCREKQSKARWVCLALCLIGVALFYGGAGAASPVGIVIALVSSVTYAFYIIYLAKSRMKDVPVLVLVFYIHAISTVMMLLVAKPLGGIVFHFSARGWFFLVMTSLAISFVAVPLFQSSVRIIGPQNASLLSTFEPITSLIAGVVAFGESFTARTFVGCVFILSAVALAALDPADRAKKAA